MKHNAERSSLSNDGSVSLELDNIAASEEAIKQNDGKYEADAPIEKIEDKEIVSLIKSSLEKQSLHESAPEGWFPIGTKQGNKTSGLVKELGLNKKTIDKAINMDPPIQGKDYKDIRGRLRTHYPLVEVAKRVERFTSAKDAPEGWFPVGSGSGDKKSGLVEELGISQKTINRAINMDPPLQGKDYKDNNGKILTYYPLTEVAKRVEYLTSTESAPESWFTINGLAGKFSVSHKMVENAIERLGTLIKGKEFKHRTGAIRIFYSPEEQAAIMEELENSTAGTSFPETAFFYYVKQAIPNAESRIKPKWLRGPSGGQMEIDIYIECDDPPRKIGIEYDGARYHDEIKKPSDIYKNELASEHWVQIIRIREKGCPDLPDNIPCINRQSNSNNELVAPIEQLFNMLNIPLPGKGIDIKRDRKAINALMRQLKGIQEYDAAESKEELSLIA